MIAAIVLGCYAVAWLLMARRLYGTWRARMKDKGNWYDDIDTGPVMLGALALGLFWPLVPAVFLLIRFMDSAPQMSQAEMRDRLTERDRRIAELERAAGITRT